MYLIRVITNKRKIKYNMLLSLCSYFIVKNNLLVKIWSLLIFPGYNFRNLGNILPLLANAKSLQRLQFVTFNQKILK